MPMWEVREYSGVFIVYTFGSRIKMHLWWLKVDQGAGMNLDLDILHKTLNFNSLSLMY